MRDKFSVKLRVPPHLHKQVRIFTLTHFDQLETGVEFAVRDALKRCADRDFRKLFLDSPSITANKGEDSRDMLYWLDSLFACELTQMCELFREEFGLTTMSFGRNAFVSRALYQMLYESHVSEGIKRLSDKAKL